MRVWGMRTGISIILSSPDRERLQPLVNDRNAAQKHVWRAEIVLLSAIGIGTNEIMRRTGKSKTCVWRWPFTSMERWSIRPCTSGISMDFSMRKGCDA